MDNMQYMKEDVIKKINNELKDICTILPTIQNGDKKRIFNENNKTIFIVKNSICINHINGAYYDECSFGNIMNEYNNENIYMELDLNNYYNYIYLYNEKPFTINFGKVVLKQTPKQYLQNAIDNLKYLCKNNKVTIKWIY